MFYEQRDCEQVASAVSVTRKSVLAALESFSQWASRVTVSCQNHNRIPWAHWVFNGEIDQGETCQVGSGYLDTRKHMTCWGRPCQEYAGLFLAAMLARFLGLNILELLILYFDFFALLSFVCRHVELLPALPTWTWWPVLLAACRVPSWSMNGVWTPKAFRHASADHWWQCSRRCDGSWTDSVSSVATPPKQTCWVLWIQVLMARSSPTWRAKEHLSLV